MSSEPNAVLVEGDNWREVSLALIEGLGDVQGANLGFLYLTETLTEDAASILMLLRAKTGVDHWVGSSALGVCAVQQLNGKPIGREVFSKGAAAAMTISIDASKIALFPALGPDEVHGLRAMIGPWLKENMPMLGLVHADPDTDSLQDVISDLSHATETFLVGGVSSGVANSVQISDSVTGPGLSGALFASSAPVVTALTQGCSRIGDMHTITRCADNAITEIDGRPAYEVFDETVSALSEKTDLFRPYSGIHIGLPITGSDTGDYLVRNLMGIDPDSGLLIVAEYVHEGQSLIFVRRTPETVLLDMRRMLADLNRRLDGRKPQGAVYVSCLGRGPNTFGQEDVELGMIADTLQGVPVVGFFADGEICHNRLYSYTGVLTVFL